MRGTVQVNQMPKGGLWILGDAEHNLPRAPS